MFTYSHYKKVRNNSNYVRKSQRAERRCSGYRPVAASAATSDEFFRENGSSVGTEMIVDCRRVVRVRPTSSSRRPAHFPSTGRTLLSAPRLARDCEELGTCNQPAGRRAWNLDPKTQRQIGYPQFRRRARIAPTPLR